MLERLIETDLLEHEALLKKIVSDEKIKNTIKEVGQFLIKVIKGSGTIFVMGNGGSAADSQHFVAELVGKFSSLREPVKAIALTTNTSNLTAISNDMGFEKCFLRQIQAFVSSNDVVIGISTSGNSTNIINAFEYLKKNNIATIALLGKSGGKIKNLADFAIVIPSNATPRIQEMHITVLHIIAKIIDEAIKHGI